MDRDNHYEMAFETYLRDRSLRFTGIDESHRADLDEEPLKSVDFIIDSPTKLLVEVKGRKFPGGSKEHPQRTWQNWVVRDDVEGLVRWEEHFDRQYRGVIVFVYWIDPSIQLRFGTPDQFTFRQLRYLVRGVAVDDYRAAMRCRSPRWGTVYLPTDTFRSLVRPFRDFLQPSTMGSLGLS
jgi:hypothetical protein